MQNLLPLSFYALFFLCAFRASSQQIKYIIDAEMVCHITTADLKQKCSVWKRTLDSFYLDTKRRRFDFPGYDSLSFVYERRAVTEIGSIQYFGKKDEMKGERYFMTINNDNNLVQICARYNPSYKSNAFKVFHIRQAEQ